MRVDSRHSSSPLTYLTRAGTIWEIGLISICLVPFGHQASEVVFPEFESVIPVSNVHVSIVESNRKTTLALAAETPKLAARNALTEENSQIKDSQSNLRDVNVELANKVVGVEETLSTLYRYAKELDVKDI